jgi:hypothetical protein
MQYRFSRCGAVALGIEVNSFSLDFTLYNFRLGPRCNVLTQRDGIAEETMRARISSIVHTGHCKERFGQDRWYTCNRIYGIGK